MNEIIKEMYNILPNPKKIYQKFNFSDVEIFHYYGMELSNDLDKIDFIKKLIEYFKSKDIDITKKYKKIMKSDKLDKYNEMDENNDNFYKDMFWSGFLSDLNKYNIPFVIDVSMGNIINNIGYSAIIFEQKNITNTYESFSPDELIEFEDKIIENIEKFDENLLDILHLLTGQCYGWYVGYNVLIK